ncbi:unnamed protein product [Bursaphelenchus xylophilus]|uniref:(pine wood nematode) hypothetical protein n=1 Tax=Bursaphelenchus xylophilus TaxID=6326 RepID=A0A1I7S0A5_BURXY|nr:unnamed protein product [Bursaphelenchus xylophilus]CAG9108929.1 unnamed protein product [Bursaphelenchus xylophilus]
MCCFCFNLHRHQIHLISYGCVAFSLISTGLVFTVFAIFQKDTQIGKIWLAGPTTMVVGLVLVGKVIIDWGPAMTHGRHGSIDSAFLEQMQMGIPNGDPSKFALPRTPIMIDRPEFKFNGALGANGYRQSLTQTHLPREMNRPPSLVIANHMSIKKDGNEVLDEQAGLNGAIDCIVYGQYESTSNSNASSYAALSQSDSLKRTGSLMSSKRSHSLRSGQSTPMPPSLPPPNYGECNCTHVMGKSCTASLNSNNNNYQDYGSIHRASISPSVSSPTPPTKRSDSVNSNRTPPNAGPSANQRSGSDRPLIQPVRPPPPPPPPRNAHLYQGETFIINERSYLI